MILFKVVFFMQILSSPFLSTKLMLDLIPVASGLCWPLPLCFHIALTVQLKHFSMRLCCFDLFPIYINFSSSNRLRNLMRSRSLSSPTSEYPPIFYHLSIFTPWPFQPHILLPPTWSSFFLSSLHGVFCQGLILSSVFFTLFTFFLCDLLQDQSFKYYLEEVDSQMYFNKLSLKYQPQILKYLLDMDV